MESTSAFHTHIQTDTSTSPRLSHCLCKFFDSARFKHTKIIYSLGLLIINMRPSFILFSLMAAHSLAAPVARADPEPKPDALTTDTMVARSAEAENAEAARMFLNELEKRESGGVRPQAA
jgi:hypothetical protein